jgi:WD40 repeat protein
VITTGIDRIARVWDAQTGDELARFEEIRGGANSAAWSPDGAQIILIGQDSTVQLRDAVSGALQSTIETETTATSVTWSPDGTQIITAIRADAVAWDAETGAEVKRLEASGAIILAVLDPSGNWLLTIANQDNRVTIWDFTAGQPTITFEQHTNDVLDAAWSPDGLSVVSGDADGMARVWDPFTGEELLVLTGHTDSITGVAWSPTGLRVLTASKDRTARVWDARSPQDYYDWTGINRTAPVWDATTGNELLVLSGHTDELTDVGWSPPSEFGDRAVTASGDQTAKIWRVWENYEDLVRSAGDCCVFRDLTPEELTQFNVSVEE